MLLYGYASLCFSVFERAGHTLLAILTIQYNTMQLPQLYYSSKHLTCVVDYIGPLSCDQLAAPTAPSTGRRVCAHAGIRYQTVQCHKGHSDSYGVPISKRMTPHEL